MALPNNTFMSPGTSFYAPIGESARSWYEFPALNGTIELIDASGVQFLRSIDGDLYYNNELLAKASDIQDVADWALYPALSTIELAGQDITQGNNITIASTITANAVQASSAIISSINTSFISTTTIAALGSITALGSIGGASATIIGNTTTGTLNSGLATFSSNIDMANGTIDRVANVKISNAGMGPYGTLTSADGTVLTWNGQTITTGGAGSASNWSYFNQLSSLSSITAVNSIATGTMQTPSIEIAQKLAIDGTGGIINVNAGNNAPLAINADQGMSISTNIGSLSMNAASNVNINSSGSNVNIQSYYNTSVQASDVNITADTGLSVLNTPIVNITAQNGPLGGNIQLNSYSGYGAAAGYGKVSINAFGSTNNPAVPIGGLIELNAYSAGIGDYGGLTSAIRATAAAIGISAGALPSIPALAGSAVIYGNNIVSICAGLPAVFPQIPLTTYIYGLAGLRLDCGTGARITTLGILQAPDIEVDMIAANGSSNQGVYFRDPITANVISPQPSPLFPNGGGDLIIRGSNLLFNNSYVQIQDVGSIAFATAYASNVTGAITGLSTINGVAYPPLFDSISTFSTLAVSSLTAEFASMSSLFISSVNGAVYPPTVSSADWSIYPAVSTVNMASFPILDVNDISIIAGATIVGEGALTIDAAGDLQLFTDGGGEINLSTRNLANINLLGDAVNLTASTAVKIAASALDMDANNIINVASINGSASTILSLVSTDEIIMQGVTNAQIETSVGSVNIVANQDANIVATTGAVNITGLTEISLQGPVTVGSGVASKDVTVNGSIDATGDIVSSSGVDNYSLNTIGALVGGIPSGFRDATEFYVSFDGDDTTGLGSILSPYQTIQRAITQAELVSSALQVCVINVASGIYTENLTFQKGYIVLNGSLQSQTGNEVCAIKGSISIAVSGTSDLFNRQITFNGFNITCGATQSITDTSTTPHIVSFQDCKCFVVNQFFVSTGAFSDMRLYMTNVEIQQTSGTATLPVIITNLGQIEFERLDISLTGNCSAIEIGGTSILSRFSLSALETTNTGTTLLPMLNITSSTTSTHTLGNVAFAISSATAKTNTSAVYIASGVNTTMLMLNNVFSLQGTSSSTNYTVGYNGVGSPAILGVNNTSLNVNVLLPQTTAVQTGITQIAYTDMNPPNMACYSTTGDQTITAVNTPQAVTFNTTQFQQGTALVASSRFYVSSQGNYQITWSLMMSHSSGTALMTSFLKKNGTTVANTGSQTTTFSGSTSIVQVSPNFILSLNAGDYVELFVASNALGSTINSTGAINGNPATPGAVFNITQIR